MTAPARFPFDRGVREPSENLDRTAIADLLEAQADALLALSRSIRGGAPESPKAAPPFGASAARLDRHVYREETFADMAQATYALRRCRDRIFSDSSLFGEPAWDILLDLTASELAGRKLSVTSACIGSCVPPTTALRWLADLEEAGLVTREKDANDGRRAFVRISPEGLRKMFAYFASAARPSD